MQVASRAQAAFRSVDTWVFDLDHTLYPPRFRLFDQIEARMARFMARELHLAPAEAETLRDHYHRTYGTTLAGLMAHHKVVADHWLHEVHEIDLDHVEPDHALRGAIDALPGRKVVFTNGSRRHAERVTEAVGLTGAFDALFGTEDAGLAPKPERSAYERVFAVAGVIGPRAAMFEDTPKNLKVPHAMGMQTVHVAETPEPADHIHHHTDDLTGFLSQLG